MRLRDGVVDHAGRRDDLDALLDDTLRSQANAAPHPRQCVAQPLRVRLHPVALEQPHERLQRLDRRDRLLDFDPPDVLDQVLERIDRAQADLLAQDALRRAPLLKAVPQHPQQLVRLLEGRVRPEIRPHRVRRPDAQRVHERVDAPRDDVAIIPARRRDTEVALQDPAGAEDAVVLPENVSSGGKPENWTSFRYSYIFRRNLVSRK